jgi:hypothetical protein
MRVLIVVSSIIVWNLSQAHAESRGNKGDKDGALEVSCIFAYDF